MFYITEKQSTTGKKFQKISEEIKAARAAILQFAKKHNIEKWRSAHWVAFGGVSAVVFKEGFQPDTKLWKNVNGSTNEWMPKQNSAAGKELYAEIKATPTVSMEALNKCVGFDAEMFQSIGFNQSNKKYFGFETKSGWQIKIPKDCKEVTETEYRRLFKVKGSE